MAAASLWLEAIQTSIMCLKFTQTVVSHGLDYSTALPVLAVNRYGLLAEKMVFEG